jgi:hypothetical protein
MSRQMARHDPRLQVMAAGRGKADQDRHTLARVEILSGSRE